MYENKYAYGQATNGIEITDRKFVIGDHDIMFTVEGIAVVHTYFFMNEDTKIARISFTVENYMLKTMPAVPVKEGYTAEWDTKEFVLENKTVHAVYTERDYGPTTTRYCMLPQRQSPPRASCTGTGTRPKESETA